MTEWRWGYRIENGSPGVPGPNPGVKNCFTPATGALPEWTVISLGTRRNYMTNLINFANETGGTKRRKSWKQHEDIIVQLVKHLNNRGNVNKETTKLVEKIRDSFDRIRRMNKWLDASTNEDDNQAQEEMEIEALNEGSGAPARYSTLTQPVTSGKSVR